MSPKVEGDPLLCPNGTAILGTQSFDSYQWYRIPWGGNQAEIIPGATEQELTISEEDMLYRIFVEVTKDTCRAQSDTVLVDGLVFLLPVVAHSGKYTFDPVQESFVICRGDTMFLELLLPYEVNITWYRNGLPLAGEEGTVYAVTEPGAYTVEGAPAICPEFIQPLGLILDVLQEDCSTSLQEGPGTAAWRIVPQPARDVLEIGRPRAEGPGQWHLYDLSGRQCGQAPGTGDIREELHFGPLPTGRYTLQWVGRDGQMQATTVLFAR